MRIATSSLYAQQTAAMDEQQALYAQYGQELSSGKQLQSPSDDPAQIGLDLEFHQTVGLQTQRETNATNGVSELNATDNALSNLTSVMQSARQFAVQGASDTLSAAQRADLGNQVDQLLQQAVAVANTQYGGKYVFAGTAASSLPPAQVQGSPASGVTFTGNGQAQSLADGQAASATFAQAFNYGAPDGSPSVFQTLITLRDTLMHGSVVDQSAAPINQPGQVVAGAGSAAPTALATGGAFAVKPQPDSSGYATIAITGANGQAYDVTLDASPAAVSYDTIDGGPNSLVAQLNALTAQTGVTATYDAASQRLSLAGTGSFSLADVPTPAGATPGGPAVAATGASNLTAVLGLSATADVVQNVSTQLGDIDKGLDAVLGARATVGAQVQSLTAVSSQFQASITDTTSSESAIEDVDVAKVTSQYSAAQVALQAAYSVTSRIESKTLMDYLS